MSTIGPGGTSSSPQVSITPDNLGPAVNVTSWICMAAMCLVAITKVLNKSLKIWNTLTGDSALILVAMVFAIGQSIATTQQVTNGLGQHQNRLSPEEIESYEKAEYAGEMLYIMALSFAKSATLYFMATLTRTGVCRKITHAAMYFTVAWTLIAIIGIAFQCKLPTPWASLGDQCFSDLGFWATIGTFDILIEIVLVALPMYLLWDLKLPWNNKISVLSACASRSIDIPLSILRIYFIGQADKSQDRTFVSYRAAMVTQIGMHLAIILACLPFLKTFMDHMQHGMLTSDLRATAGPHTNSSGKHSALYGGSAGGRSVRMSNLSGSRSRSVNDSSIRNTQERWTPPTSNGSSALATHGTKVTTAGHKDKDGEGESRPSSVTASDKMIIKHSMTFTIESEPAPPDDLEVHRIPS